VVSRQHRQGVQQFRVATGDVRRPRVRQRSTQFRQRNCFAQISEIGETGNIRRRGQRASQIGRVAAGRFVWRRQDAEQRRRFDTECAGQFVQGGRPGRLPFAAFDPGHRVHRDAGRRGQFLLGQVAGLANPADVLAESPCHRHVAPFSSVDESAVHVNSTNRGVKKWLW
jgi:hypothetical protein